MDYIGTVNKTHPNKSVVSFKLTDIETLDRKILFKIKNNSNDQKKIRFRALRKKEQNECKKMIDWATNRVTSEYQRTASFSHISKTNKGYTVQLICSSHKNCKTYWSIRINLVSQDASIICNDLCNPKVSKNTTGK